MFSSSVVIFKGAFYKHLQNRDYTFDQTELKLHTVLRCIIGAIIIRMMLSLGTKQNYRVITMLHPQQNKH